MVGNRGTVFSMRSLPRCYNQDNYHMLINGIYIGIVLGVVYIVIVL
jgi:hypothetical protein